MRGTIIFALATLVVPTLTAAVPLIDTPSLNVESDVKRHTEFLNADQAKRTTGTERLPVIERAVLADRGRGAFDGGDKKRNAEPTEGLVGRDRKVTWPRAEPAEDLVKRLRKVTWPRAEPVEDLVGRDRKVTWPRAEPAEPAEDLVKRLRKVTWPRAEPAEDLVE